MKTDSILNSVKKVIGYPVEYTDFDKDLLVFINMEFSILHQHGVGPSEPFIIDGPSATWEDFMGSDDRLAMVESLVCMRVKVAFDPPQNSFVMDNLKNTITELEWRLYIASETIG